MQIKPIMLTMLMLLLPLTLRAQQEEYSDPRFPSEHAPVGTAPHERGVQALEQREQMLQKKLEQFPLLESRVFPPHQYFGYLSEHHPTTSINGAMEAWVQLSFFGKWTLSVDGIALVPAYYPAFSADSNYGFPKRFRIEVYSHKEPDKPETVVDWTHADFPDPGLHPVFFSFAPRDVQRVRLVVTRGAEEKGAQFFALDELMVFQQGNNVAPPAYQGLTASDSHEAPPYWKLQYLTNRKIHVGGYFHTRHPVEDFVQYFNAEDIVFNKPEILIDLGSLRRVGRVELYPAQLPGIPIPEFGFPLRYRVDLLKHLDDTEPVSSQVVEDTLPSRMRWHALSSNNGRWLRITLLDLPEHNGRPVLALGEIRVIGRDGDELKNFAAGQPIRVTQVPEKEITETALLNDGFSNGRQIMQERLYIRQLAERKIVGDDLRRTREHLLIARATRSSHFWTLGISSGTALFFSLILWIAYQRIARQRALMDLRRQIAADLHDDISSNLGTISMITKRLQLDPSPSLVREKLVEIGHIAQESFVSVKEIIWHMDSDVVHLSEMLQRIEKTARSILTECQVECRFPSPQGIPVPPKTRRNIMLLVKEALYNSAKYAKARHMLIRAELLDSTLELSLKDDGVGFDPATTVLTDTDSGRGLANMERRARLLGAELKIDSEPDQGTQVVLSIPLSKEP